MKIIQYVLLVALNVFSFLSFSQKAIVVDVSPAPVSMDTQFSFTVVIPQTVLKEVQNDWLKYVSKGSKGKVSVIDGVYLQPAAVNKTIAAVPFNVYSTCVANIDGVRLNVWIDSRIMGGAINSGQHLAVQKYVYDFAIEQYREAVQKELQVEQAKQKDLERELAVLIKGEDRSAKTLSENQRSAVRANDAIATNNSDIRNSNEKISDQKDNVTYNAGDPNAAKGAMKTLDELEQDKKDLQRKNEMQGKDMDNMNKENREETRNIITAQMNQQNKMADLEKQKAVVRAVQKKLDNIK